MNQYFTEGAARVIEADEMGFYIRMQDFDRVTICEPDGTLVETVSRLDSWIALWFLGVIEIQNIPADIAAQFDFEATIVEAPFESHEYSADPIPYYAWSMGA